MSYILKLLFTLLITCCVLLAGCDASLPKIKPFKMDIQQGNVVTSKMLLQLKPGMTKSQVRFIMGTPLILDSFHKDRWDYFYQMRQAGKVIEQRRVILEFDKELLTHVRGDVVPQGTPGAATEPEGNVITEAKSIEPRPKEEKSWLDKLKFWEGDEKAAAKPQVAAPKEEKSWLDKLKFWKNDEKPAVKQAVPAESPKIELPKAETPADVSEPSPEAPSVLVVPISGVAPEAEVPAAEAPAAETPKVEAPVPEQVKEEPVKVEPLKVETPAAQPKEVPTKPAPLPMPEKPVPEKIAPAPPVRPATAQDGPFIFRMDKNLDMKNLEAAPKETAPAAVDNKAKPKKAEPAPLPVETEPSFFDRMLEKIGF